MNDALKNLSVTGVKFSVEPNQKITTNIENGFSVHMSGRIALIMGYYQKYLNESTTSTAKFDTGRPFKTLRLVSNLFIEPGGDFSPFAALWIHSEGATKGIYYKPDNFRYLQLSSWINEMTFSCRDISGDPVPVPTSPDTMYIVIHFTRRACHNNCDHMYNSDFFNKSCCSRLEALKYCPP